jgi:hypothetical protein
MTGTPSRASRPSSRALRSLVALSAVTAMTVAGCSSGTSKDSAEPDDSAPAGQSTSGSKTMSAEWPLTGLPVKGERSKKPVMVVKIDNTYASQPQVGLGKADLITEELVEGGATRLAVFYNSQVPKTVGPVRSFRASDIGIVQPAHAVIVASGGAGPTVARMRDAKVATFTEGAAGFYRDSSRSAPYNLFMNLPKLASTLKPADPPSDYLPWGKESDFPKGQKARTISAQFSGGHTTNWTYSRRSGGGYTNTNSYADPADQFTPDTVVVLRVAVGDAGYLDPAGNHVPETKFTGKGEAMVFHDGRMVRGTWSKKSYDDTIDLSTRSGELTVPAGHVWIELVPAQGGNISFAK